ncbi:MAG: hypothetical protein J6T13_04585 [Bacteroidales bacterium]|nr:hypothetical protein [Bacteroidales bacterium]MBQ4442551.1 hypothetical protein [Bacteroidales bacterium]MCR4856931.1 hypothetical protein [Bacteroidales bacterium]
MRKLLIILCLAAPLLVCCDMYNHPTIPNAKVDFIVYPNDVMYYRLNTYGGYEYFTGGVNGIVVYRLDEWTFMAYDRACSYDWEDHESWLWVAPDGLRLVDSLCGSTFNILDGNVLGGPAIYPARRYATRFDGARLRIYS